VNNIHRHDGGRRAEKLRDVDRAPDSWIGARLQSDQLLPVRFYDLTRRRGVLDGETRLAFAVLEDAVRTYVKHAHSPPRPYRQVELDEVRAWFDVRRDESPFSFRNICETLGVDPDSLRNRLGTLRPEHLSRRAHRAVGRRYSVFAAAKRTRRSRRGHPASHSAIG